MKKPFKAGIALLIAGMMVSGIALANEGKHGDRSERHLQKMQERLELSDEQVEQLRENWKQQHESRMEKREEMRSEMRAQLADILTPEQLEKMDEQRSQWHKGGDRDGKRGMKGDCGDRNKG
ncbi:Spy/CpxP family protein refolding chaperone [Nitrincola sp. MINF-07-Sa-05]|uniref:Spy/CpxP family protein refolding chaperone n=1 Tax=Nitrincola salilacus TaxID=3400273 RepID=UPI003917F9DD